MCDAVGPVCGPTTVPSPKSKRYEAIVPSASLEPDAFAATASGSFPVPGLATRTAAGGWLNGRTETAVVADPESAFAAVNVMVNVPVSPAVGVQCSVPIVSPAPATNPAWFPAGRFERSAPSAIESPSASEAVTVIVSGIAATELVAAGAITDGARSTLLTAITVVAAPARSLLAVKVTA